MFQKIWDSHVVHAEPGQQTILYIDLQLVHEVTSPQAFEGLRLAGRKVRRPELTVATPDHNIPTTDRSLPIADPISRQQVETLRAELPRVRHQALRHERRPAGHRPRHRPGAGHHAAGHDDRLRRQPHGHARRVRGAGVRHRHQRSRARAGHANAAAVNAQDAGAARRRPAAARRDGQGPDPVPHRPDHDRRRHRLRHRIHRRGDPRPDHGRADDRLQHVDRSRRPGRHDRPRRDDLRLHPRPRVRAPGRRFRQGRRPLEAAADRSRREVRQVARLQGRRHLAAGHLGHQPRPGRAGHGQGAQSRRRSATRPSRRRPPARSNTWA